MLCLKYENAEAAVSDIEANFIVPKDHFKKSGLNKNIASEIQRNKELYVLKLYLKTNGAVIKYPVQIECCGEYEGFPDFVLQFNDGKYFVEISSITNEYSQLAFQGKNKTEELSVMGPVDLTNQVKEVVNSKNRKIDAYRAKTGISRSILLIYHNQLDSFSPETGDILEVEKIESRFGQTYLLFCDGEYRCIKI